MKRVVINIVLIILFFITLLFVVLSLTICNDNFIIKVLNDNKYYEKQIDALEDEIGTNIYLSKKEYKNDVDHYINKKYVDKEYSSKIEGDNKYTFIYNKYVKFNNVFKNVNLKKYIWIIYIATIILVFITGTIFLRTQNSHNLNIIVVINFILSMIFICFIYIFDIKDLDILNVIKMTATKYYMAINIIILEILVYNKIKSRFIP